MDFLSVTWLYVLVPLVLALAIGAPLYVLLALDVALVWLPGSWRIGDMWLDPSDLVFAGLVAGLILRPRVRRQVFKRSIPYVGIWLALGILASAAYLSAPMNSEYLTNPIRIAYQLYRYAWKPLLYFPVAALLIDDRRKLDVMFVAIVAAADAVALQAISQGYAGDLASGPFATKNALGGVLVIPMVLAVAGVAYPASPRQRIFWMGSALMMARALLFSQSRGAQVAVFVALAFFAYRLFATTHGRSRLLRLVRWVALLAAVILVVKPNVLQSPDVQRVFSTIQGADDETMQWRMQERWPHFWQKVVDHPLLGVGTDVDPSLGDSGNTPHSGFLAMACIMGIPATCLLLVLILRGIRDGLRVFKRGSDRKLRVLGLTMAAALIGALVHNIDDATLPMPFIGKTVWMLTAAAALAAARRSFVPAARASLASRRTEAARLVPTAAMRS